MNQPEQVHKAIGAILKRRESSNEENTELGWILQSMVNARQTDAWQALLIVFRDLHSQFIQRAAFCETQEERLEWRGAAKCMDSVLQSMTDELTQLTVSENENAPEFEFDTQEAL